MAKTEIKFKASMDLEEAVEYLEKVVGEFKKGKYIMEGDGESLLLEPQGAVKLEIEAKQKDGSQELEIELSWKTDSETEEEEEEGEEEGEEEARQEKEDAEVLDEGQGAAPIVKILPLAGLAAAGGAAYGLINRRRKSKLQKASDKARKEGEKLIEEGEKLLEQGESVLEKGTEKARKLLKSKNKAEKKAVQS